MCPVVESGLEISCPLIGGANWRSTRNEGPGATVFCAESRSSTRSSLYWMGKIGSRKVD
jgi:hypothetical protein